MVSGTEKLLYIPIGIFMPFRKTARKLVSKWKGRWWLLVHDFEFKVQGLCRGPAKQGVGSKWGGGVAVVVPLIYHRRDQMRNRFCRDKSGSARKEFTHRDRNGQASFPGKWARLRGHQEQEITELDTPRWSEIAMTMMVVIMVATFYTCYWYNSFITFPISQLRKQKLI